VLIFSPTFSSSLSGSQSDQSRPFGVYGSNIYDWGLKEYLQDSQAWLERGLVDLIRRFIAATSRATDVFIDRLVTEQFTAEHLSKLAPILLKLGSYRISPEYLLQVIKYNRYQGHSREVFFFYEGLREDNDALARYCDRLH